MDQTLQIQLLRRCLMHQAAKTTQLESECSHSPLSRYTDKARFQQEVDQLFCAMPMAVTHSSQLPDDGFVTLDIFNNPLLISRDSEGQVHAFFNVCRHRGSILESVKKGCKHRFRCPYHGWTYSNKGELIAVPHQAIGFPELDRSERGLISIPCEERFGFVWLQLNDEPINIVAWLGDLERDMQWMACDKLRVFNSYDKVWNTNWKLFMEGGVESYHFRETHSKTIAPYFPDNLSVYDRIGNHFRSVLPKRNLGDLEKQTESEWDIRQVSNILYSLLPNMSLLVQPDHIAWISAMPLDVDKTHISIHSLVPQEPTEFDDKHWQRNFDIEVTALVEDFEMAEGIQKGLATRANETFLFGRFESALEEFHKVIDEIIMPGSSGVG
ncbi:MAG: aromatic ring-hydroxylating oxygenase subunit alpha [Pseudomonadales bacterium]